MSGLRVNTMHFFLVARMCYFRCEKKGYKTDWQDPDAGVESS